MTAVWVLLALSVGVLLGAHRPTRRAFNRGVAAGRESERLEHGWPQSLDVPLHKPRRRWGDRDRQVLPRTPRVLDDMPSRHR